MNRLARLERDEKLFAEWKNFHVKMDYLASKYGLCTPRISQILKRMNAQQPKK